MKKLLGLITAVLLALGVAGIAMAADGDLSHTGRVIFVTGGDVEIGTDEQADAVVVVSGDAHIAGTVNTLFVVDGGNQSLEVSAGTRKGSGTTQADSDARVGDSIRVCADAHG